jgi:hypothetical protein
VKNAQPQKPKKEKQLELGLKSPLRNRLYQIKDRIAKIFAYLEIIKFLKDPLNWLFLTLSLSFIAIQSYFIYTTRESLPTQLPIFSYFTDLEKKLVSTNFIYALPVISLIVMIAGSRISYRYFHKERVMSVLLLLSMLLSIILVSLLVLKVTMPFYE